MLSRFVFLLTLVFALSVSADELVVAGLEQPVEIIKDKWGVSHIYAQNQHDLFFAQGFSAARDRLFQFETWRRKALGIMAEVYGESAIAHDEGARLLRFRGDINEEMAHYHEDGVEIITAFVAGVNANIDLTRRRPELLPFEFALLDIEPGYWTPEIVISRHNALTGGMATEVMLSKAITALGPELTRAVLPFEREPFLEPMPGIDLSLITDDIMAKYRASRSMPVKAPEEIRSAGLLSPLTDVNVRGSNNWVIAGSRTKSGKPLMANDPHRAIQNPSLRYLAHLNAPGWNVIGAGEPVLPGLSIGHNEYGAWGLTVFRIDQEDLYVYETNPENPDQYRYEGKWRDMEIEKDVIHVRDGEDVPITLKYSVHGPVVHEDERNSLAYGMRAAWLEVGSAPYLASLRMDQATNWEEFRDACGYSGLPGENMVWADKHGDIGWQAVGFTPIRFGWDGRLPVPGNGDYEWQGLVPIKAMPHIINPAAGWYGTANHNNVPRGYPNIFSDFYSDPARIRRMVEILDTSRSHTIGDSRALQYDNKSMTAEKLTPYITALEVPKPLVKVVSVLKEWDFFMNRDSVAAIIYDKWELAMLDRLNDAVLPGNNTAPLVNRVKLLAWVLEPPEFVFGPDPKKGRERMILASLEDAVSSLRKEIGPEMADWEYGKVHVAQIDHPLSHLADEAMKSKIGIGPLPRGGASNTLNANRGNTRQVSGGSFRIIVDTADWDSAIATNAPGQSGDPDSPYYRNLFENWNRGDYFPLYFSRKKVESVADTTTLLTPQR